MILLGNFIVKIIKYGDYLLVEYFRKRFAYIMTMGVIASSLLFISPAQSWDIEKNDGALTGKATASVIQLGSHLHGVRIECNAAEPTLRFLMRDSSGKVPTLDATLRFFGIGGRIVEDKLAELSSWNSTYLAITSYDPDVIGEFLFTMEQAKKPIEIAITVPVADVVVSELFSQRGSTAAAVELLPICLGYSKEKIVDGTFKEEIIYTRNLMESGCSLGKINFGGCVEILEKKGCTLKEGRLGECKSSSK